MVNLKRWIFVFVALLASTAAFAQNMPSDYAGVIQTLGKQGDFKDNVLKVNIPRNDAKVTIEGITTPTPGLCRRGA